MAPELEGGHVYAWNQPVVRHDGQLPILPAEHGGKQPEIPGGPGHPDHPRLPVPLRAYGLDTSVQGCVSVCNKMCMHLYVCLILG